MHGQALWETEQWLVGGYGGFCWRAHRPASPPLDMGEPTPSSCPPSFNPRGSRWSCRPGGHSPSPARVTNLSSGIHLLPWPCHQGETIHWTFCCCMSENLQRGPWDLTESTFSWIELFLASLRVWVLQTDRSSLWKTSVEEIISLDVSASPPPNLISRHLLLRSEELCIYQCSSELVAKSDGSWTKTRNNH